MKAPTLDEILDIGKVRVLFHMGIQHAVENFMNCHKKEIMEMLCKEFRKSIFLRDSEHQEKWFQK